LHAIKELMGQVFGILKIKYVQRHNYSNMAQIEAWVSYNVVSKKTYNTWPSQAQATMHVWNYYQVYKLFHQNSYAKLGKYLGNLRKWGLRVKIHKPSEENYWVKFGEIKEIIPINGESRYKHEPSEAEFTFIMSI